ncbi:MAG: DUF1254 domain-containing protein [Deltaproteobacteria bacterium]|nr:DUF1254 domain-containing protein [Deltaproteobacteria bacterium]
MKCLIALALGCLAAPALAQAPAGLRDTRLPSPQEIATIAKEAYLYGYPLVTMDQTRAVMTNVATPNETRAPLNQLVNQQKFFGASFHDVTAPNADTLYSNAWIDLSEEPMVFAHPDMGDRYFLFPFLDAYTNVFAVPGTRTTGHAAETYLLTGPGWHGTVPKGMKQLRAPTNLVWLIGRLEAKGTPEDDKAVHALQENLELLPLSAWGAATYKSPRNRPDSGIDMKTSVRDQVNRLGAEQFFDRLARLLALYPPPKADAPMLAKLARIGIVPGEHFSTSRMNAARIEALRTAPAAALEEMQTQLADRPEQNGWAVDLHTGTYGTDYLQRATVALVGLGANKPEDAVYPLATTDASGQPLTGGTRYVIHFPKGELPPAKAFWSITLYDEKMFFVSNALDRHSVGSRDALKINADGSLDVYVQADAPSHEKRANWLPAPSAAFTLMMRIYWPRTEPPSVLDGSWKPPPVTLAPAQRIGRAPHRHRR